MPPGALLDPLRQPRAAKPPKGTSNDANGSLKAAMRIGTP